LRWKDLKAAVEKKLKGNNTINAGKKDNNPIIATVINPLLLLNLKISVFIGAFTTPEYTIYPFASSTVYNNYSTLYIVNSVSLLKPSSIKAATPG
jgi:hypothetical protein